MYHICSAYGTVHIDDLTFLNTRSTKVDTITPVMQTAIDNGALFIAKHEVGAPSAADIEAALAASESERQQDEEAALMAELEAEQARTDAINANASGDATNEKTKDASLAFLDDDAKSDVDDEETDDEDKPEPETVGGENVTESNTITGDQPNDENNPPPPPADPASKQTANFVEGDPSDSQSE